MTTNEMKLNEMKKTIDETIIELKKMYNNNETTLNEMYKIMDYARLLNVTDFVKTITD